MSSTSEEAAAAQVIGTSLLRRIASVIGAWQQNVSDRVHAEEEDFCTQVMGWTATRGTGWFGFGTRTYRDPRMDSRAPHGKAPRDGVQITHLGTVTARGGA
jgi:hypothetical protein